MNRQEAIHIIKNNLPNGRHMLSEALEFLIPELKDEKMKREILELVSISGNGNQYEEIKDWLEKQCEQKIVKFMTKSYITPNSEFFQWIYNRLVYQHHENPDMDYMLSLKERIEDMQEITNVKTGDVLVKQNPANNVEPKFKVGDWIVNNTNNIYKVLCIIDDEYRLLHNIDGKVVCAKTETIDKKCHLWTIQDAKDGDVLYRPDSHEIFLFEEIRNRENVDGCIEYHCVVVQYRDTNEFHINRIPGYAGTVDTTFYPASKEQRDLLFQKMHEAGYEWDAEKKELKKIEQKPAEKKYTFNAIPRLLSMIQPTDRAKAYCQKLIDILIQEGYSADAKIVGNCLKQMNGEKIAMATMDKQEPSLPSNLDEAAEEYAWQKEEPLAEVERLSTCFNPRIDAFKVGAEWMAGQKPTEWIQWTGKNLKEIIDFTGKSARFDEWFKSWDEYETYVHSHGDILKLFCADGSHYEVPVGAWIVKTPDGYNIPSRFRFVQKSTEWSEEDVEMIDLLISILEINHPDEYFKSTDKGDINMRAVPTKKITNWLKSLKDRGHLQPKQEWRGGSNA